jgi:hypothetical protein
MSKLKFKKIEESAGAIVSAKGFWYHPCDKIGPSINPTDYFDFLYIGTYPINRQVYIWNEGIFTCILYSVPSTDGETNLIAIGGSEKVLEKNLSPKELIRTQLWTIIKDDTNPKTFHETNLAIRYVASKIRANNGLLHTEFPVGWKVSISSKILSQKSIIDGLLNK